MAGGQPLSAPDRRLRVLLVTPDYPPERGGIQRLLHDVAHNLADSEVTVVTQGRRLPDDRQEGVRVRRVSAPLRRLHGPSGIVAVNALALAEGLLRVPDVILSGHVVTAPAAVALARLTGRRFVQMVYGAEVVHRPGTTAWACRRAAAVIACSAFTAGLVEAMGAEPPRVSVIHPGIAAPLADASLDGRRPTVVWVARMRERYKGLDVLLRGMRLVHAAVPQARLEVIGDGPLRPALEAQARALGLADAVRFHGSVDDAQRDALMDAASCLVMVSRQGASRATEGFGIVYLEAGAHGLAVVGGREGGAIDAIEDGVTGLLVDPTDHVATADAVIRILADDGLRRRLAAGGQRLAREHDRPRIAAAVRAVLAGAAGRA